MLVEYTSVDLQRNELTVLSNVSFKVNKGEFIYLLGKVGSGKSTLLKSIYADVPIKQGSAQVLGYNLTDIRSRDIPFLRRNIGFVFQDFQLLMDRSVFDNLDFVLKATGHKDKNLRKQRIEEVLSAVNMNEKSYKMPYHLSGGEQQRVVIARALLNYPHLILADEPTGNLDKDTGAQIMKLIYEISKNGTSVIMATHNTSWIDEFPGREMMCENKRLLV